MKILINFLNIIGPSANDTNGSSESQANDEKKAVADESKDQAVLGMFNLINIFFCCQQIYNL